MHEHDPVISQRAKVLDFALSFMTVVGSSRFPPFPCTIAASLLCRSTCLLLSPLHLLSFPRDVTPSPTSSARHRQSKTKEAKKTTLCLGRAGPGRERGWGGKEEQWFNPRSPLSLVTTHEKAGRWTWKAVSNPVAQHKCELE